MDPKNVTFQAGVAVDHIEFFDCALPQPRSDCDADDFQCGNKVSLSCFKFIFGRIPSVQMSGPNSEIFVFVKQEAFDSDTVDLWAA